MATKTPRTTVKDFLQSVNTENEARRTLRRRSMPGDPEGGDSARAAPESAGKQRRKQVEAPSPCPKSTGAVGMSEKEEVTPRHIIESMLTVQSTVQPVTRKRKRMSDVAMGPPASVQGRKTARRRSSISAVDLDDVTSKFTPRTNIAGFLQQVPEKTPAARKSSTTLDSHSTTQNVSSFMINEVGVSMLETRSGGDAVASVSASSGRFRGKKGNLNIPLPQISPSSPAQQSPAWTRHSRTSTPKKDVTANAEENVNNTSLEVLPPVTPLSDLNKEGPSTGDGTREVPEDTAAPPLDTSGTSEGKRSKGSDRNVFDDVFGGDEGTNPSAENEDAAEIESPETAAQGSPLEREQVQGGYKAQTPSAALSPGGRRDGGAHTPFKNSHQGSPGERSLSHRKRSQLRMVSPTESSDTESPRPKSNSAHKRHRASTPVSSSPPPPNTRGRRPSLTQSDQGQEGVPPSSSGRRSATERRPSLTQSNQGQEGVPPSASGRRRSGTERRPSLTQSDQGQEGVPPSSSGRRRSGTERHVIERHLNDGSHSEEQGKEEEAGTTLTLSRTSKVSRLSSRQGNRESAYSVLERKSDGPQDDLAQEDDFGVGAFAESALMPESTHRPSDQEDSSEGEGYSPLKTPRLPEKQCTPNTAFARLGARSDNDAAHGALTANTKRKASSSSRSRKKPQQGLPPSVVKAAFSHFCQLRVSKEAIEEVAKMSEQYWKNMAQDLEAYALHARRQTVNEADVELLMKRQGFITDTCSLNTLIAKYLPLELRKEMIPIARSGNKLEPSA